MRNELNDIEKIERYLRNEMNSEERISFEKEMQNNPDLRKSVEEQKELLKGMERMKMKNDISKGKFKYRLQKGLVNMGIPVLITAAVTALILNWSLKEPVKTKADSDIHQSDTLEYKLPELNENGDSLWADADKYIPYQIYSIDTEKDTVITGKDGMVVAIPANCFVDENGNTVKGKIDFELKEALDTKTILEGGLSTTSNGELLETGGMFYINARQDGKSLKIAKGKNIYADVPSDPSKTGMMLFDGERLADGNINWENPKPIEKPLVPVDIHSLNFYPPLYEDSLTKMGKDVTNKKYKDSLYYSFAGRFGVEMDQPVLDNHSEQKDTLGEYSAPFNGDDKKKITDSEIFGEKLFNSLCTYCHKPNDDYTGPALKGARKRWKNAGYENKIYEWVQNPSKLIGEKNPYALTIANKWKAAGVMTGKNLTKEQINSIFDYVDSYPSSAKNLAPSFSDLNPAKVKSIWNDKFQNTLIATKEFEERMPYIHKLCSRGNNILDMYVRNIDKRICTIDSMVANTLSGADKEQFLKFASRGEGRVKTDDNCLKKLGNFYDEQTKIYIGAARKTAEDYYKKNREEDDKSNKKYTENAIRENDRYSANFQREMEINLNDAYRQLDKPTGRISSGSKKINNKSSRNIPRINRNSVRTSISQTGWKNVDRYVSEATQNRTSMVFNDKSGKKAVLKYEPLSVKIKDAEKYDRVLVYLLPDQLNSFMRMKKEGDSYTEKLNMLFKHEIIVLAYKGEEAFFKHIKDVQPGELNDISLEKMSQIEINANLTSLNKLQHTDEMQKDVSHQFFLQADAKRRKVFLEKEKFIRRIERVIFPCGNDIEEISEGYQSEIKQEF